MKLAARTWDRLLGSIHRNFPRNLLEQRRVFRSPPIVRDAWPGNYDRQVPFGGQVLNEFLRSLDTSPANGWKVVRDEDYFFHSSGFPKVDRFDDACGGPCSHAEIRYVGVDDGIRSDNCSFSNRHSGANDDVLAQPCALADPNRLHLGNSLHEDRDIGPTIFVHVVSDIDIASQEHMVFEDNLPNRRNNAASRHAAAVTNRYCYILAVAVWKRLQPAVGAHKHPGADGDALGAP